MAKIFPQYELHEIVGSASYDTTTSNVKRMLEEGCQKFGNQFREKTRLATILVNGVNINYLQGMATPLRESDEVWFVLPSAGG